MAQILKARGYYDPQDMFECKLLLSLRGPVVGPLAPPAIITIIY